MDKRFDLTEILYQRGEAALLLEQTQDMLRDYERELRQADSPEVRDAYADGIRTLKGNINTLERVLKSWDEKIPLFMTYEDAIELLRKVYRRDSFYHFTGLTYAYSTDSRFDYEALLRAIRSTGTRYYYLETTEESYWRIHMTFTPAVLAEIQKDPTPEKTARRGRKRK